jgi:hypothetical protein
MYYSVVGERNTEELVAAAAQVLEESGWLGPLRSLPALKAAGQ